ncbi:uncharacterized protein K452DRAFT_315218 [Aplosporella prunicola CBS 121167]|uniref:LicD/FKTN/FKRP nucleotidyltransferase domain-containing protein n=1 Tax=Aplosporella prunicola CBS 121167 TaxID=1176127 RepID=A0A6A6BPA8_9PEZI|nr:uncharacterized protein K452DRAFT_315218 [Aplosporella prunicola CBS 121167]KAF2145932.1 hypothetical protein K452DRAFT_315218 [Aplosporella prunicola CBS 121167]
MRFLSCAAVAASACFFALTLAHPVPAEARKRDDQADREATKYFHEPGGDDILGHYDIRYFKGVVSYDERIDTIQHMTRAYLDWFREEGLETWIAHGTLLGWWWSGTMLPWDWDVDTQVAGSTLAYMAKHHNRTIVKYDPHNGTRKRQYLLDVNPWQWERVKGDGMNIIDARWIDTHNGLYIDITGLSETEPDTNPGVLSCKNNHKYSTSDLFPMRRSTYEGVPALIPYAYDKMLIEEYQAKSLTETEYEGHKWDPALNKWVKMPEKEEEGKETA